MSNNEERQQKGVATFSNDAPFLVVSFESLMNLASQVETLNHLTEEMRYIIIIIIIIIIMIIIIM